MRPNGHVLWESGAQMLANNIIFIADFACLLLFSRPHPSIHLSIYLAAFCLRANDRLHKNFYYLVIFLFHSWYGHSLLSSSASRPFSQFGASSNKQFAYLVAHYRFRSLISVEVVHFINRHLRQGKPTAVASGGLSRSGKHSLSHSHLVASFPAKCLRISHLCLLFSAYITTQTTHKNSGCQEALYINGCVHPLGACIHVCCHSVVGLAMCPNVQLLLWWRCLFLFHSVCQSAQSNLQIAFIISSCLCGALFVLSACPSPMVLCIYLCVLFMCPLLCSMFSLAQMWPFTVARGSVVDVGQWWLPLQAASPLRPVALVGDVHPSAVPPIVIITIIICLDVVPKLSPIVDSISRTHG